jgi:hypothetical protein
MNAPSAPRNLSRTRLRTLRPRVTADCPSLARRHSAIQFHNSHAIYNATFKTCSTAGTNKRLSPRAPQRSGPPPSPPPHPASVCYIFSMLIQSVRMCLPTFVNQISVLPTRIAIRRPPHFFSLAPPLGSDEIGAPSPQTVGVGLSTSHTMAGCLAPETGAAGGASWMDDAEHGHATKLSPFHGYVIWFRV